MSKKLEEEEFPDDFDIAYEHFANSMGRPESSTEPETSDNQQPVLNKREYTAFSEFLDHVLDDPSAARKDEVHWLDLSMYDGRVPTGLYVSMDRVARAKSQSESDRPAKQRRIQEVDDFKAAGSAPEDEFVIPPQKMTGLKPNPLLSAANAPTPEPTDEEMPKVRNSTGQQLSEVLSGATATMRPFGIIQQPPHMPPAPAGGNAPSRAALTIPHNQPMSNTMSSMNGSAIPHTAPLGPQIQPRALVPAPHPSLPHGAMLQMAHGQEVSVQHSPMPSLQVAASSEFYRGFVETPQVKTEKGVDDLIQAYKVTQWQQNLMALSNADPSLAAPATASPGQDGAAGNSTAGNGSATARRRRENLSVDEVRNNHIMSEKRRRDNIKQLFSEMCSLVPAIAATSGSNGTAPPKSVVMQTVYKFLVDIADQNRQIRRLLVRAGARTDNIPAHKLAPPLPETEEEKEAETPIY